MKIYLNLPFLENFYLSEQTDNHFYLNKILTNKDNNIELIVDFDFEEIYKDSSKRAIFRQIAQKIPIFDDSFINKSQFKEFHEDSTPKLFFIDNENLDVENNFGCFHTTSNKIENCEWLYNTEDFRIDKTLSDWSILNKIKHPCNALILTDNYLFTNDSNYENLISVLKNLLPRQMMRGFDFDLTLIGYNKDDSINIPNTKKEILERLRVIFNYKIKLTILRRKHHGRYIFTNYYRINSERGFCVFRNNGILDEKMETSIDCKALTVFGKHSSTLQTRNDELAICKDMADKVFSYKINRLLK